MSINLRVPDNRDLKPRITVFGVGGAGGNAVNNMIESGLDGVEFVVANTDAQALASSRAQRRIQMGAHVTEGLGAGSKPEIGAAAAEEAIAEIKGLLSGCHMVFITAGMGGGTGTGAAPVIARASREEGILTVGVVTKPFHFEGVRRMRTADAGIIELQKFVDTLIIIPNQNLFRVANEKTTFADAFAMADDVLRSGVACITDLMVKEGLINLDFADVKTVMAGMGKAMMGTGESTGERRAIEAAEAAISNPLLDDVSMKGASGLLISITGGSDLTLYEVDEAASRIREEVDCEANIILGATYDDVLDGKVRVSVVATGIALSGEVAKPEQVPASKPLDKLTERIAGLSPTPPQPAQQPSDKPLELKRSLVVPQAQAKTLPQPATHSWQPPADITIEKLGPALPTVELAPIPSKINPASAPFIAAPPAGVKRPVRRMPQVEDFPVVGQKEIMARTGKQPQEPVGIDEHKKKAGFLERLAGVGRGKKDAPQEIAREREPDFGESRPAHPANPQPVPENMRPVRHAATANQPNRKAVGNEEELEIPAFLRRQAN